MYWPLENITRSEEADVFKTTLGILKKYKPEPPITFEDELHQTHKSNKANQLLKSK